MNTSDSKQDEIEDREQSKVPHRLKQRASKDGLNKSERDLLKNLNDHSSLPGTGILSGESLRSAKRRPMTRSASYRRHSTSNSMRRNSFSAPIMSKQTCEEFQVEREQGENILVESGQRSEEVLKNIGAYYEMAEKFEEAKAQNKEYVNEIAKMKTECEKQQEDISGLKNELDKLVAVKERNGVLERENMILKTELALARCRSEDYGNRRKKEENETRERFKELEDQNQSCRNQNKSLENEIISLKLQLANSQGMADWHAMELRQVSDRLSTIESEKAEQLMDLSVVNKLRRRSSDPFPDQRRGSKFLKNISSRLREGLFDAAERSGAHASKTTSDDDGDLQRSDQGEHSELTK